MGKRTVFMWGNILLAAILLVTMNTGAANAEALETEMPISIASPSVMLLEADSGAVIFEKNADERRPAASITKLMTALIVLEKLENNEITLEDRVTVSPNAAAVTGSQVLLDAHEQYPVAVLLQSTVMASGNDSAVALAEYIAGTEEAFAKLMNDKAKELGLVNTVYVNCTGLPADGQYTSARDIAVIAREICKHPLYFEYASVWMDELEHPSGRITELTNTNRLVRFYHDCDGLKTGSTNEAKYCVCATAFRNNMRLIAIVLGSENSQLRFDEARTMMDYGFASYRKCEIVSPDQQLGVFVHVKMGQEDVVEAAVGESFAMLLKSGQENTISLETELYDAVTAPVQKGELLGNVNILMNGRAIAKVPAVAAESVRLPGFLEGIKRICENWK